MLIDSRLMLFKLIPVLGLLVISCGTVDTGSELRVAYPSAVDVDDIPSLERHLCVVLYSSWINLST